MAYLCLEDEETLSLLFALLQPALYNAGALVGARPQGLGGEPQAELEIFADIRQSVYPPALTLPNPLMHSVHFCRLIFLPAPGFGNAFELLI